MLFRGGAPRPSTDADDDTYTDDEKARILADRDASGSGLAPAGLAAWWG